MIRSVVLTLGCLAALAMGAVPSGGQGNPEAKKIKNPIPSDATSI